jgi:hypothetical protein
MVSIILILNILISIIHPLKYIPQIIHINESQSVNDLSLYYLQGETVLNILSMIICIDMTLHIDKLIYFFPIIFEKLLSLIMILYITYLKKKFSIENTWTDVSSIDSDDL